MASLNKNIDDNNDLCRAIEQLVRVIDKQSFLNRQDAAGYANPHYFWDISKQTLRWYLRYLEVLNTLLDVPLKKKYRLLEMLLIIALVRIEHLKEPDHYIVNHSVAIAKKLNFQWASGLVNRILRTYLRERLDYQRRYQLKPSLKFAHPGWLIKAYKNSHPSNWEAIVLSNQMKPKTWINTFSINHKKTLEASLNDAQFPFDDLTNSFYVEDAQIATKWVSQNKGYYIQDVSAQLLTLVLKQVPKPYSILDACAAPGGKTFILMRDFPDSKLLCSDVSTSRLETLVANLSCYTQRRNFSIKQINWCDENILLENQFDLIVFDAPCSGSGIVKRHPEKKFHPWNLEVLLETQTSCLRNLWSHLKAGGHLIYSTCSVLVEENDLQMERFLNKADGDREEQVFSLPLGFKSKFGWQILPNENQDGHYFCILKKLG